MKEKVSIKIILLLIIFIFLMSQTTFSYTSSPVTDQHINYINNEFKKNGIKNGFVVFEEKGRLELKGSYENEQEVDRAFSIAQTIVGIRWVSPVTPEFIKVKEWEKKLSGFFPTTDGKITTLTTPSNTPPGPIKNRYAMIAGVARYQNHGITQLKYTTNDARSFYDYTISPRGGAIPKQNVFYYENEQATRTNIVNALNHIKAKAGEDDLVILYLSSHGTPPDKFGGVHVVTYDTQVEPRHMVWSTSLSNDIMKDFIQNLRAKRLVVIMDTCYSNGAYANIPGFLPPGGRSLGVEEEEGYGLSKEFMSKNLLGARDLMLEDAPVIAAAKEGKQSFLGNEWGKVLISASGSGEKSWESDSLRHGYFTKNFVDGLNRYNGRVNDAFFYTKPIVTQQVKREKGAEIEQNPQIVADRKNSNLPISYNK
jgi:hypothetical protein